MKESYVSSKGGTFGRLCVNTMAAITMIYLFLPIFVIVIFSFNDPTSKRNFVWKGFTLKHWIKTLTGGESTIYHYPELTQALFTSVRIALITAIVATALGTLLSFALAKYKPKSSGAISTLLVIPLTTPEIVLAASLFTLFLDFTISLGFVAIEIPFGMLAIIIAHIMFCMSFVTLTIKARFKGFPWVLEEAAEDLGAKPFAGFMRVIFPLALPGIFAALLLSFALSMDDFIITLFVRGDLNTFPTRVYGQYRTNFPPQVNILSTIMLIITTTLFVIPSLISIRKAKKSAKLAKLSS